MQESHFAQVPGGLQCRTCGAKFERVSISQSVALRHFQSHNHLEKMQAAAVLLNNNEDKIPALATLTDKISALAMLTDKISALATLTDKISALATLTDKISALTTLTDKISALAMLTDKISALATLTDKISALATLMDKILALAMLMDKILALAIMMDKTLALATLNCCTLKVGDTDLDTTEVTGTGNLDADNTQTGYAADTDNHEADDTDNHEADDTDNHEADNTDTDTSNAAVWDTDLPSSDNGSDFIMSSQVLSEDDPCDIEASDFEVDPVHESMPDEGWDFPVNTKKFKNGPHLPFNSELEFRVMSLFSAVGSANFSRDQQLGVLKAYEHVPDSPTLGKLCSLSADLRALLNVSPNLYKIGDKPVYYIPIQQTIRLAFANPVIRNQLHTLPMLQKISSELYHSSKWFEEIPTPM
ncbi:hypothetical protein HDU80_002484, partial [Chytriomyces hyalinus]